MCSHCLTRIHYNVANLFYMNPSFMPFCKWWFYWWWSQPMWVKEKFGHKVNVISYFDLWTLWSCSFIPCSAYKTSPYLGQKLCHLKLISKLQNTQDCCQQNKIYCTHVWCFTIKYTHDINLEACLCKPHCLVTVSLQI